MKFWFFSKPEVDLTNRKIFRAALIVGAATLVAKCAATAKELAVARTFGRGDSLDAFLIAVLLPTFVLGLVMGALETALLPTFIAVRQEQGIAAAQRLFAGAMVLTLLLLSATGVLLALFAPYYLPYLGAGFSPDKLRLTCRLLYALLPFVLFSGIARCAAAVMNAGENFALPALIPLLTPLFTIFLISVAPAQWGAFSLALGTVAGSACEAVILIRSLRNCGLRFSLRWYGLDQELQSVLRQYVPMLAGAFLMGGTMVVDQSMAAMLPAGSVSALNYGNKIITVILAIGSTGLSTAALPYFSKMAAEKDWSGCRYTLKKYSLLILMGTMPLTLALMVFSMPLVRLLFQRGAFGFADTQLVSRVQICYSLQIPFYIWNRLPVRFLSAVRRNDLLMYASGTSLILDIVLNLVFMKFWGVAGIALSTSCVYIFTFMFLTGWSIKLLAARDLKPAAAAPSQMVIQ
jgi:putative peptidoglycan lipid II flippase